MNLIDAPTPSAILFEKLQRKITPTGAELAILRKRRRVDIPDDNIRASVVDLNGRQLTYIPQIDISTHTAIPENLRREQVIDVAFINMSSAYGIIGVRNRVPDSIGITHEYNVSPQVNFVNNDPYLDRILNHGLSQFPPKIETTEDLKGLTDWVRKKLPYAKSAIGVSDDNLSLGDFIEQYGSVCRHNCAVEFALLELYEIDATPISVKVYNPTKQFAALMNGEPSEAGGHMYLEVRLNGNNVMHADPTSGICEKPDAFKLKNESLGYFFRDPIRPIFQGAWKKS